MDTDFMPQIDSRKCTNCNLCVRYCPHDALDSVFNRIIVSNPEACDYSGICQDLCPTGAISLIYEIILQEPARDCE